MTEAIVPQIYNAVNLDEIVVMEDGLAFEMTRRLAIEEGIFAGISSGAAVAAALQIAAKMTNGVVVVILPDRGDRRPLRDSRDRRCGRGARQPFRRSGARHVRPIRRIEFQRQ